MSDDGNVSLFDTRDYTKTTSFQGKLFVKMIYVHVTFNVKVVSDGGPVLACAWNDTSDMIAVSSHEGMVHVYDVRQYHHTLAKIGSTEVSAQDRHGVKQKVYNSVFCKLGKEHS